MLRSRRIFCSICASSIDQYWLQPHLFYGTMVANIVRDTGQPFGGQMKAYGTNANGKIWLVTGEYSVSILVDNEVRCAQRAVNPLLLVK